MTLAWHLFGVGSPAGVLADEKAAPKLPAGVWMERDLLSVEGRDGAQRLDLYLPERLVRCL